MKFKERRLFLPVSTPRFLSDVPAHICWLLCSAASSAFLLCYYLMCNFLLWDDDVILYKTILSTYVRQNYFIRIHFEKSANKNLSRSTKSSRNFNEWFWCSRASNTCYEVKWLKTSKCHHNFDDRFTFLVYASCCLLSNALISALWSEENSPDHHDGYNISLSSASIGRSSCSKRMCLIIHRYD